MKKLFFVFLLCVCKLTLVAQVATVEGTIKNLGSDTVFVEVNALSNKNSVIDTTVAHDGHFIYTRQISEPAVAFIKFKKTKLWNTPGGNYYFPDSKRITVILLPNDRSLIQGKLTSSSVSYKTTGNPINQELAAFYAEDLNARVGRFHVFNTIDSLFKVGKPQEVRPYSQQFAAFQAISTKHYENYISSHPNSDLSVYFLACFNNPEAFGAYLLKIDPKVRNGLLRDILAEKNVLHEAYLQSKFIKPGAPAAAFSLTDINGKSFSLESQRGKFVVLDFWGSWCKPCLEGMPAMKAYYEKYKSKVAFIGIACNDQIQNWKAAVDRYGLSWTQLINDKDPSKNVSVKYGINLFPTKILIDPDGRIVSINSGEEKAFYAKLDQLLGN